MVMSEVKVYPPIILKPEDSFGKLLEKLYAEGWGVNSAEYMQADTLEEAVKLQAKSFPCLEFQPVQLSKPDNEYSYHHEGKWVAFHRTPKPRTPDSYGDWLIYYNSTEKYWFLRNEKTLQDHPKHFDHPPTLEEIKEAIKEKGEQSPATKPELSLDQVDWKTIFETMSEWNKALSTPTPVRAEIFNLLVREGHNTKRLADFLLHNEYAKKICEQIYPSFIILSGLSEKPDEKPARLVQVNKEGDGLCVVDGVTGNVLETWGKEVTLDSIRLHFPDAIITGNAQEFLNAQVVEESMDDEDEVEVGDELIDKEGHRDIVVEPKDTSRIPIILAITATITKRELTPQNQHPISLNINGKAHPYVSSGSDFGAGSTHDTVDEALKDLHQWISQQKQWFTESYHRPIIVKLETINEVTTKQQNLQTYY